MKPNHFTGIFQKLLPRTLLWAVVSLGVSHQITAQCDASTIDLCEIGKNSIIQASFHAQIIKTSNGYSITGQDLAPSGNNIQVVLSNIPSTSYPMPTGVVPVWGAIGGRTQAVFVGSDSKIYALGRPGLIIDESNTRGSAWGETKLSLPDGITVCDISKWEGSAGSGNGGGPLGGFLAFSTHAGAMYITGDGAGVIQLNASNTSWTKMTLPVGVNVVDFAAGYRTMLVLGNDGKLYASGPNTFLGNGSRQNLTTLTLLTQPQVSSSGINQIEAGVNSYLVLDGDGTIHVLGQNSEGSLGVGNSNDVTTWSKVGSGCPSGILRGVAYISTLSSHDNRSASSAILVDETIRSWGLNDNQSITSGAERIIPCPIRPDGNNSSAIAIANGGHISPYVNRSIQICNIGHNREGAFGDGNNESGDYGEYTCFNIPGLPEICGTREVDLELQKTAPTDSLEIGDSLVFTITISNQGPGESTGSTVRDQIPSGFRYITDDGKGAYNSSTGLWTVGPLGKGESLSLNIRVKVLSTGNYTNYAQIFSDNEVDPDSSPGDMSTNQDDDDSVTVSVIPCPFEASCLPLANVDVNSCEKLIPNIYDAGKSEAEISDIFENIVTCGEIGIKHNDALVLAEDCSRLMRTYQLTDDGQVVRQCFREFSFLPDDLGPDIQCPEDVYVTCGDPVPNTQTFLMGIDNCSPATSFSVVEVTDQGILTDFCLTKAEVLKRIYTAVDDCGNLSTCNQDITFEPEFYIPNVFHPNSKAGNHIWTLSHSPKIELMECLIYDRWGNLIYRSESEKPEWTGHLSGKECEAGVYVYVIYYQDANGMDKMKTGEIALVK